MGTSRDGPLSNRCLGEISRAWDVKGWRKRRKGPCWFEEQLLLQVARASSQAGGRSGVSPPIKANVDIGMEGPPPLIFLQPP